MAKRKQRTYKETKALVKRKQSLLNNAGRVSNISDRTKFRETVRKANYKTISAIEQSYELYTDQYINTRLAWNGTALNMRMWAVIKRYYDLVGEGKIKPRFYGLDNYEKYAAIEGELSVKEMEELIEQANKQAKIREDRLNRKAKMLSEESMASFDEGARMLGLINFG